MVTMRAPATTNAYFSTRQSAGVVFLVPATCPRLIAFFHLAWWTPSWKTRYYGYYFLSRVVLWWCEAATIKDGRREDILPALTGTFMKRFLYVYLLYKIAWAFGVVSCSCLYY